MRTLVCDDQERPRRVLADVLRFRGHDVLETETAAEVLAAHDLGAFPLIVLASKLGDSDGLSLCRKLRALPHGDEAVIIIATDSGERHHVEAALDAGASDYVTSPYDAAALEARIAIAERRVVEHAHRALTEEARAHAERSFRGLIEGSPDAVVVHRRGRIVYVNRALLLGLGYDDAEQLVGRPYLELVHAEDRAAVQEHVSAADGGASPASAPLRMRMLQRDGNELVLETLWLKLKFDGELASVCMGRDVTDHIRMESQLLQANRMVSVGTLAAGIAHEINNPLSYVISNLKFMSEEVQQLTRELPEGRLREVAELLVQADEGAERVRAIVRDMRSFSRTNDVSRGPVHIQQVLDSAVNIARDALRRRATVVRNFGDVPYVKGNEAKLGQVFVNLLVNAAQALPEGQPEAHHIELRVEEVPGSNQVLVQVSDTGEGMDLQTLGRVFDPFFTTKPVGVGTGLGLSICHNIVTELGGTIDIQSARGRGTTVSIRLPVASELAADSIRPSTQPATARPARILVVDDEPGVARSLRRALREHDVTIVLNGRDALDLLSAQDESFDLVFCDLLMPEMTGMELYEQLGQTHPELRARMIFMTGDPFVDQARSFLEAVPNRWFEKPFDIAFVKDLVAQAVAQRQQDLPPPGAVPRRAG